MDNVKDEPIHGSHYEVSADVKRIFSDIKKKKILERYYEDNPYVVLGITAVTGYVVAGGLFSPFTRRLIRIGMKAVLLPVALTKISDINKG